MNKMKKDKIYIALNCAVDSQRIDQISTVFYSRSLQMDKALNNYSVFCMMCIAYIHVLYIPGRSFQFFRRQIVNWTVSCWLMSASDALPTDTSYSSAERLPSSTWSRIHTSTDSVDISVSVERRGHAGGKATLATDCRGRWRRCTCGWRGGQGRGINRRITSSTHCCIHAEIYRYHYLITIFHTISAKKPNSTCNIF